MKIDKKDLRNMSDEDFLYYLQNVQDDEEQRSLSRMLAYACMNDKERIIYFLGKLRNGAKLRSFCGGEKAPYGYTYVGSIEDGSLFIAF